MAICGVLSDINKKNRGLWEFFEPITEAFRKFYGYIKYSKLYNFSLSLKQGWTI